MTIDLIASKIDWYLEERLKGTKIKFIHDNLDYGLGLFKLENGKYIGFAHGHQDNINTVLQNFLGATKQFVDYICIGHIHNLKQKSFQNCQVYANGSIVVGTDGKLTAHLASSSYKGRQFGSACWVLPPQEYKEQKSIYTTGSDAVFDLGCKVDGDSKWEVKYDFRDNGSNESQIGADYFLWVVTTTYLYVYNSTSKSSPGTNYWGG